MAKQGQHRHDKNDPRISKGPNNPDKSVEITTGSYKKPETYKKQAAAHDANTSDAPAQHDKNDWVEDTRKPLDEASGRHKDSVLDDTRSGSESNAD